MEPSGAFPPKLALDAYRINPTPTTRGSGVMPLPNDVARCAGYLYHSQCGDCQRRTDRPKSGRVVQMAPPEIKGREVEFYYHGCSYYIEPDQQEQGDDDLQLS